MSHSQPHGSESRKGWLLYLTGSVVLWAWSVSLVFHLATVLIAAFFLSGGSGSGSEPGEEVEGEVVVQLAPEPAPAFEPKPPPPEPAAGSTPPAAASKTNSFDDPFGRIWQPDQKPAIPSSFSPFPSDPLANDLDSATKPFKPSLPGSGGSAQTDFFGTASKGAKFVYVIDRSASMQGGLDLAKSELLASLSKLPQTAEFQVIFYDLEATVMKIDGQQGLVPATQTNKEKTARLLETIRSEGGTDHARAIQRALTLKPHVIYFLTDADELRPQEVQELTALNQRAVKARIHCIELSTANLSRKDNAMRLLAQENRGEYQGIDVARFLRNRP